MYTVYSRVVLAARAAPSAGPCRLVCRGGGGVLQGHRRLVVSCFSGTRLSGHFDSVAPITRVGRGA
eukprot:5053153-Prymnesium_polylepis.1